MIEAINISKQYGSLKVLNSISLNINRGEVVAVVGPSGAGKTTLLQILGTLDKADSGSLTINGVELSSLKDKQLAAFRNQTIGFVFQFHQLLPEFTALENIMLPGLIAQKDKKILEERANKLLELLGMSARKHHKPKQLSGGEAQRIAVARALINEPAVVFADEPSGNLDTQNAADLHNLFFKLRDELNQTFVIITHNNELAKRADRTLELKDGVLN